MAVCVRCCVHAEWEGVQEAIFGALLMAAGNINVYDIRLQCTGALCYDFSRMAEYLAQPSVQEALGVVGRSWVECNPIVYGNFLADWMLEVFSLPS
jgi:carboxypeptidase C (cathepsin A)